MENKDEVPYLCKGLTGKLPIHNIASFFDIELLILKSNDTSF